MSVDRLAKTGSSEGGGVPTYDDTDVTPALSNGDVLAQGYCHPAKFQVSSGVPTHVTGPVFNAGGAHVISLLGADSTTGALAQAGAFQRGHKTSVKGRVLTTSDTLLNANYHKFAIGAVCGSQWSASTPSPSVIFGHVTGAFRDDLPTVAAVVDSAEDIQTYNSGSGDNAPLTDTTYNADTSAGFHFEIIVSWPSTATNFNQAVITIKISDSSGTLRTVANAVTPLVGNTSLQYANLAVMMNTAGHLSDLVYKIEKVA